jgi:hypothetical protein
VCVCVCVRARARAFGMRLHCMHVVLFVKSGARMVNIPLLNRDLHLHLTHHQMSRRTTGYIDDEHAGPIRGERTVGGAKQ